MCLSSHRTRNELEEVKGHLLGAMQGNSLNPATNSDRESLDVNRVFLSSSECL